MSRLKVKVDLKEDEISVEEQVTITIRSLTLTFIPHPGFELCPLLLILDNIRQTFNIVQLRMKIVFERLGSGGWRTVFGRLSYGNTHISSPSQVRSLWTLQMISFYFNFKVHVEQINLKKNNSVEFISFYYLVVVEQLILLAHESNRLCVRLLGLAEDTAHDVC